MEIREYQSSDEIGWIRCRVLAFLNTPYYDIVVNKKEQYHNPSIELVALEDGQVIGLLDIECEVKPNTICTAKGTLGGMVWNLAVHPNYQKKGVGSSLLKEAQKRLKDSKVTYLELWAREDKITYQWYEKHGFKKIGAYLHVYVNGNKGIQPRISGLIPVQTFCQYVGNDWKLIKSRYERVYECHGFVKILN